MGSLRIRRLLLVLLLSGIAGSTDGLGGAESVVPPFPDVDRAIDAGLDWLVRHQGPDGSWSGAGFAALCQERCPILEHEECLGDDSGVDGFTIAMTGLAVLALVESGTTHRDGGRPEHGECQRKAIDYLLRQQTSAPGDRSDGQIGGWPPDSWIYNHAIATLALARVLEVSGDDQLLGGAVAKAAEYCLRSRNEDGGWRYFFGELRSDSSVTGWMAQALKAVETAGGTVSIGTLDPVLDGVMEFYDGVTSVDTGVTGYRMRGDRGSLWAEEPCHDGIDPYFHPVWDPEPSEMTAQALACRLLLGQGETEELVRLAVDVLGRSPPRWQEREGDSPSTVNFYYWYFCAVALLHLRAARDPAWESWRIALPETLLANQRRCSGCDDGSWDPVGAWGTAGGRVYSTAMAVLALRAVTPSSCRNGLRDALEQGIDCGGDCPPCREFRRGDPNADGKIEITDAIGILNYLFLGAAPPSCESTADTNDDSVVDITDAVSLLSWLFVGGTEPPAPGPFECGVDPTPDTLSCDSFPLCP